MAVPDVDLRWATGTNAVKITGPSPTQIDIGYDVGKYPTQGEFNYLFNGYYQWFQYLTANVTGAIEDVESISKDFTYLDDTTYGAISDPTANDKINKKVSASQDISIQSTAVGIIEGLDYSISNSGQIVVEAGSCYLYKGFSSNWNTPVLKYTSSSQFVGTILGGSGWHFFGSGGIVAPSSAPWASGVTLYVYTLGSTASSGIAIIGDTSSNGSNAITTFASTYSVASDTVYLRRIASTVIGNYGFCLDLTHKGNYTSVRTHTPLNNDGAGRYAFVDTAGVFIPATGALPSGSSAAIDLVGNIITPVLPQSTISLTISYNGTISNRHTIEVNNYIGGVGSQAIETSSNDSSVAVSNNAGSLVNASTFTISVTTSPFNIRNISTGSSPASDILYLDVKANGWTDYREQYKIG